MMAGAGDAVFFSMNHVTCCLVGGLLSLYALYVETKKQKDPKYVAACDINDNMSCSRVLTSEYSKGFGIVHFLVGKEHFLNVPNCIVGMIFFMLQLLLGLTSAPWATSVLFYTSAVACLGCVYLAYVLCFVLQDICLVCMATYVVNFYLFYLNYQRMFA